MSQGFCLNKEEADTYSRVTVLFILFSSNLSQISPSKTPFPLNKANFPHGDSCYHCCLKSHKKPTIAYERLHLPKLMGNSGRWCRGKMKKLLCSEWLFLAKPEWLFLQKTPGPLMQFGSRVRTAVDPIPVEVPVNWAIKGASTQGHKGIGTFSHPGWSPACLLSLGFSRIKFHLW